MILIYLLIDAKWLEIKEVTIDRATKNHRRRPAIALAAASELLLADPTDVTTKINIRCIKHSSSEASMAGAFAVNCHGELEAITTHELNSRPLPHEEWFQEGSNAIEEGFHTTVHGPLFTNQLPNCSSIDSNYVKSIQLLNSNRNILESSTTSLNKSDIKVPSHANFDRDLFPTCKGDCFCRKRSYRRDLNTLTAYNTSTKKLLRNIQMVEYP